MTVYTSTIRTSRIGAAVALLLPLALPGCVSEDSRASLLYDSADAYRGGALWDKWWKVPGVEEAIEPGETVTLDDESVTSSLVSNNPLYATHTGTSTRTGSQTWRCKECHGWDYEGVDGAYGSGSHNTGFSGVLAAGEKTITELFAIIHDGEGIGEGHAFGAVMSEVDVADLVKFVREGTIDTSSLIAADKSSLGTAADGEPFYADSCTRCHGDDGKKLDFNEGSYTSEYVFDHAHGNPWEFVHKVRFGQPDGEMPNGAVKGYVLADIADILAYVQSLATPGLIEASASRGGVLWDKWWKENGSPEPTVDNSLYGTHTGTSTRTGSQTWRCKECHGWDYKGLDGAYGSGSHNTGFPGVMAASDWSAEELLGIIGSGRRRDGSTVVGHAFETTDVLGADDVADLALFVKEELVEDADYISYETRRSKGSAVAGQVLFAGNCSICHGASGLRINFAHGKAAPATEYVGDLSRDNPWEVTHKVRFGHPGSAEEAVEMEEELGIVTGHMPSKFDAGYSEQDVSNVVAYAQQLPGSVERGGAAWDKWWKVDDVAEPIEPGKSITLEDGSTQTSQLVATNPLYATHTGTSTRTGSQTWRCKECHGWDYKGVDGAYGAGSHNTNFPGVILAQGKPAADLYAAIFDGVLPGGASVNHAYGAVLGDAVTRDLVHFVQSMTDYDADVFTLVPNEILGGVLFQSNCANCHGADGRAINFKEGSGNQEYIGDLARDNPWEAIHKVIHGQPGSDPRMPNAAGPGYSMADVGDIIWYAQQLP